jgi:hypothetical protein
VKMTIEIDLPELSDILASGCPVPVARKAESWSESCLGSLSKEKGVYVIHHAGTIKYVGKTDGPTMYFAKRLLREFSEGASQGKHNYPKLSKLTVPPAIMVQCFPLSDIRNRLTFNGETPRIDQMIATFEIAMINHLDPEFQRYFMTATAKQIRKALKIELGREPSEEDFKAFLDTAHAKGKPI